PSTAAESVDTTLHSEPIVVPSLLSSFEPDWNSPQLPAKLQITNTTVTIIVFMPRATIGINTPKKDRLLSTIRAK
ncbi:MAG: hypothetical protein ACYSUY_19720, partial [Planctomycetota bacterium]